MIQEPIVNSENLGIRISNVVASASLDQSFDLLAIFKVLKNVEYRPKEFPGLVFRLKRPEDNHVNFPFRKDGLHGGNVREDGSESSP